jgi:hypothetical protein
VSRHVQRPGPVAWLVILVGFGVMARAVVGVFAEAERTAPASWFTWLIGGALVHDLVVLPLVLLVGAGFASLGRPGLARSLRWAVAVGAVVTVASFPVVARFGARSDNPTVLPLPAGRNLVLVWVGLLAVAVVVGLLWDRRLRRAAGVGSEAADDVAADDVEPDDVAPDDVAPDDVAPDVAGEGQGVGT